MMSEVSEALTRAWIGMSGHHQFCTLRESHNRDSTEPHPYPKHRRQS